MAKMFKRADGETVNLLDEAVGRWHDWLRGNEFSVGIVMVEPPRDKTGNRTGPALMRHGVEAAATVGLVRGRDRVHLPHDALISIAADLWEHFERPQRVALLDHELSHLKLEEVNGRPVLRTRPADFQFDGFVHVAGRHGSASFEVQHLRGLWERHRQALFPFAEEGETPKRRNAETPTVVADEEARVDAAAPPAGQTVGEKIIDGLMDVAETEAAGGPVRLGDKRKGGMRVTGVDRKTRTINFGPGAAKRSGLRAAKG